MFRHLSDKELIQVLIDKRQYSPIIEELCKRLEEKEEINKGDLKEQCPICLTDLTIDYIETTESIEINLKPSK